MSIFKTFHNWVKYELADYSLLLQNVPTLTVSLFAVSVVLMNLLASKEIHTGVTWFAFDCGFLVSWVSFLAMDMITKRFGAKAAIKISLLAVVINLLAALLMYGISKIPGNWSEFFEFNNPEINAALDNTIGGTWYILLGSTVAFVTSSVVNAFLNTYIGKLLHKHRDRFVTWAVRSYVSTFVGQFVDNMVFALIVSLVFFGWSIVQCITCSIAGCIMELLMEVIFSPLGYKICRRWEKNNIGKQYLDVINQK